VGPVANRRPIVNRPAAAHYFASIKNVGTIPAADENPVLPDESQLEHPCTLGNFGDETRK